MPSINTYYVEDYEDAKRNRITIRGGSEPAYNAILSEPIITDEVAATNAPTLSEVKLWCSIDGTDRDAEITSLIDQARDVLEKELNKSFVSSRTITVKVRNDLGAIELPFGPVIGIVTVTDADEEEVLEYDLNSPSVSGIMTMEYEAG